MASRVSRRIYAPPEGAWLEDIADGKVLETSLVREKAQSRQETHLRSKEDSLLNKLLKAGLREEFHLYPHQVEGVKWLQAQEKRNAPLRGGILADDMGLGKTLQVVCLLLLQGAKASENKSSTGGGTLILCPKSVLDVWLGALGAGTAEAAYVRKGTFQVHQWMGPNRTQSSEELSKHDVVITTYETYRTNQKGQGIGGAAGRVKWSRVVLDEATKIKNQKSATFQAAAAIQADCRWALTATPLENSVEDFVSLLSFLQYCHSEIYPALGKLGNGKTTAENFCDRNFAAAWDTVLRATTLRRTKEAQLTSLGLKDLIVERLAMSARERAFYEAVKERGLAGDCSNHLVTMLRLRQAANAPQLERRKEPGAGKGKSSGRVKEGNVEGTDGSAVESGHIGSSKLDRLLHHLRATLVHPDAKVVIFSCFTGMLDVLERALESERIRFARLDGTMSTKERQAAIARYEAPNSIDGSSGVPVFLISLKAGGTGLTLLGGTRPGPRVVILFDHWWNPAAEAQAIDRVHRIGQQNPVTVIRFLMEDTIEEVQTSRKDDKSLLFRAVFGPIENLHDITRENFKKHAKRLIMLGGGGPL